MIPVASLFLTMLQFLHHHQIADHEIGNMHPPSKSHAVGNFFTIHYNSRFFFLCYFRQKNRREPYSMRDTNQTTAKHTIPLHSFVERTITSFHALFSVYPPLPFLFYVSRVCDPITPLSLSTTGNNSIPTLTSIILPPPPFIHLRSRIHLFPIRNYLLFTMPVCNQQSNRE